MNCQIIGKLIFVIQSCPIIICYNLIFVNLLDDKDGRSNILVMHYSCVLQCLSYFLENNNGFFNKLDFFE